MVNGVTAPEELGEQPKDAEPAREPHGQKGELGQCWVARHPPAPHHHRLWGTPDPGATRPFPLADTSAVEVKSLDLLAALPTPPHNQTEDVR